MKKRDKLLIRKTKVPGDGPVPCDLAIIGEAPGKNEVIQKKPFVGRSGKFLMKSLESLGVKREEVYITNVVKFRPCQNLNGRLVDRKPDPKEIASGLRELRDEINEVNPKRVLLLGLTALEAIFPLPRKMRDAHGLTFSIAGFGMVRFIPTFHPAVAMRNRKIRKYFLADLKRFRRLNRTNEA